MTQLPAEGRRTPAPVFPLPPPRNLVTRRIEPRRQAREATLWDELWATPQAVMWERSGWAHEVAMYARLRALSEDGDMKAVGEARQAADRLGLTPMSMLRLRWEVVEDEVGEVREEKSAAPVRRLRAIKQEPKAVGDEG